MVNIKTAKRKTLIKILDDYKKSLIKDSPIILKEIELIEEELNSRDRRKEIYLKYIKSKNKQHNIYGNLN